MICIGIDPGESGGIAVLTAAGSVVRASAMPQTKRDVLDALRAVQRDFGKNVVRAVLEHVWSSPGWGHAGAFKFGGSFHSLEMALVALGIPYELVLPKKWQAEVGVIYPKQPTGVKRVPRDKNITKRRAQALFPTVVVTHANADALLLAEYCRRVHFMRAGVEITHGDEGQGGRTEKGKAVRKRKARPEAEGVEASARRRGRTA